MYVNAGFLFRNAAEIGGRLADSVAVESRRDALVTITLATISTEAFINELHHYARDASGTAAPGWINALRDVLEEAEKSRASIEAKYQLASFIMSGQPFDRGAPPFQDFALLIKVRNLIVHLRPQEATVEKGKNGELFWVEPSIMRSLQIAGVLKVSEDTKGAAERLGADAITSDLLTAISSRPVARWACSAAAGIVNGILELIPKSRYSAAAESMYRKHFQLGW